MVPSPDSDVPEEFQNIEMPITGELDLHTIRPSDIGDLIPDYLEACLDKGITEVRVVHGKGTGALKKGVLAILDKLPIVHSYKQAHALAGGWGATMVYLERPDSSNESN